MAKGITQRSGSPSVSVGKPLVEVKLEGSPWRIAEMIHDLPNCTNAGAILAQKATAERIKRDLRKAIREDGAGLGEDWSSLSQKTVRLKTRQNYASRAKNRWLHTGAIYNNFIISNIRNNTVVHLKPGVKNHTSGGNKTLVEIAAILEIERPLFRPIYKKYRTNNVLKSLTIWHIRNIIMKKHGVRAKIY